VDTINAGVATVDITPPVGITLAAYHRPSPSDGLLDRLSATAITFGDTPDAVIVGVDNVGLLVPYVTQVREEIARALGISRERVMITCTHTHSGPPGESADEVSANYLSMLRLHLVDVARQAFAGRRAARVATGVTTANIGVNRRERGPDGRAVMGTNPDGPVDKRVGILSLHDAVTDKRLGVLVVATAHGNVLKAENNRISGDYTSWTRELLMKSLDCPILIANGSAGDINARWRGSVSDLSHMAHALGGAVLAGLPDLKMNDGAVWMGSSVIPMRLVDIPPQAQAENLARAAGQAWGVDTSEWLQTTNAMRAAGKSSITLDLEIAHFRIGDWTLSGIPMEPFTEIALEVSRRLESSTSFFCGYTNGYIGYLATAAEFPYGGYEVDWMPVVYGRFGMLMPPQPDTAEHVVSAAVALNQRSAASGGEA
jgi:hypothetical protein